MEKKEKTICLDPTSAVGNILIYDSENIRYFHGVPITIGTDMWGDSDRLVTRKILTAEFDNLEELNNITLDDTTMKRIAKFNKETDIKKLDTEIEEKKKQIKELDDILQDRVGRIDKLKEFVKNLYQIDLSDDEDCYDDDEYY